MIRVRPGHLGRYNRWIRFPYYVSLDANDNGWAWGSSYDAMRRGMRDQGLWRAK